MMKVHVVVVAREIDEFPRLIDDKKCRAFIHRIDAQKYFRDIAKELGITKIGRGTCVSAGTGNNVHYLELEIQP